MERTITSAATTTTITSGDKHNDNDDNDHIDIDDIRIHAARGNIQVDSATAPLFPAYNQPIIGPHPTKR